jgi:glutaredoxin
MLQALLRRVASAANIDSPAQFVRAPHVGRRNVRVATCVVRLMRWLAWCATFMLGAIATAMAAAPAPADASAAKVLEVFVRSDCPHCADAKAFLVQLARDRPGLQIVFRTVDQDPLARDALVALSLDAGVWPPGVPTFVFGGQLMVGFDDAEHVGRDLIELIDSGSAPKPEVRSALFGTLNASQLGLPLFTLALGLLDGFNPCAMWVLLFLLSLLVRLRDRRRMALVAGTFVLVSGAVYYAFMAAWLNIFLAVGLSDPVRWTLGAVALAIGAINVKDFVARGHGLSLSIPASAKPGLYARMRRVLQAPALPASLLAVAVLAVVVNFVELLCTAGIPAIYTAVLAQQQLSGPAHYAYLGLYILGYIADDSVMVAMAVIALGSGKLGERAGRGLKLVSGAVMLVLGAIVLLRPDWLT